MAWSSESTILFAILNVPHEMPGIYTRNGHNLTFLPEVARSETGHSEYKKKCLESYVNLNDSNRIQKLHGDMPGYL